MCLCLCHFYLHISEPESHNSRSETLQEISAFVFANSTTANTQSYVTTLSCFGGKSFACRIPEGFRAKHVNSPDFRLSLPKKSAFFWWRCSVTSYNHKCWILSWRFNSKRKERHKDDANLRWKILLTWELSSLFAYSLTSFSLKSIDTVASWMHCYSETTYFLLIRNNLYISCELENSNPETPMLAVFLKHQLYAPQREIISTSCPAGVVFTSVLASEESLNGGSSPQNFTKK